MGKFRGVRNGIDLDIWDPASDAFLPINYDEKTFVQGKGAARAKLQERLGLAQGVDGPLIGIVSRLTPQKGIHLIKHAAYKSLERGCQFVLLGSAPDPRVQAEFDGLAADIILVPSMFEPCGLT